MLLNVDSEDLDWVDSQADLSLRLAQRSLCWFSYEAAHIDMIRHVNLHFKNNFAIKLFTYVCLKDLLIYVIINRGKLW